MANVDSRGGAKLAGRVLSIHVYPKQTNAIIYPGDFVMLNTLGKALVATAGSTHLLGVSADYVLAADTEVTVYDDPDQQYYLQDDGAAGTLAATAVGQNIDLLATAGNTTLLKSQHRADTNTVTFVTANLRILDKFPTDDWGDYVRLRVVINEHVWAKKLGGTV